MATTHLRDEAKNRVREAADIVQVISEYVDLKRAGTRYTGLCPFHAEKTPSFSVNAQGQFFHCFGCGESGDVFSFLMKYNRMTFPEALKDLARRYQIELPESQLSEEDRRRLKEKEALYLVNEKAAAIYQRYLDTAPAAKKAREYLAARGVSAEMGESFRLGYAPHQAQEGWNFIISRLQEQRLSVGDIEKAGLAVKKEQGGWYDRFRDRVLFPIMDMGGRVVAFGGRILGEGQPKYMNSPESPVFDKSRLLFGLYQHREGIRSRRQAIVVEGNFDLLLLAVHGFDNVVAPLGTALTKYHIRSLRGYCDEVILLFDGDSAGLKAATRSIPFFLAEQVDARVALLPEGEDPDSLVREKGPDGIHRLIEAAQPLAEFLYTYLVNLHGTTLEGKNKVIRELQEIVTAGTDSLQRSLMIAHFSDMLGIPQAQFEAGMMPREEEPRPAPARPTRDIRLTRKERQLVDFLVYYPEYLKELLECGLESIIDNPAVCEIVTCLKELAEDGVVYPDRLLSRLPEQGGEKKYVTRLLVAGSQFAEGEDDQEARKLCDELMFWLRKEKIRIEGAALKEKINQAHKAGDHELLIQLLQQKQELGKNS